MRQLETAAALLVLVLHTVAPQDVVITSVWPSQGSLAGGTRMHIRGSGFSTNMNPLGNVVMIGGKYRCDVIPLHSTVNQIACKTGSAIYGSETRRWDNDRTALPDGWTELMAVHITVDGARNSTCQSTATHGCAFKYTTGWYHSPRIQSISPGAVSAGDLITVKGYWYGKGFANEEIKAPSQEIPLVSVKVANRPGELADPKNEPFGSSGARCSLFSEAEEPFGILPEDVSSSVPAREFKCQVGPAPEAHRYNLSVAVLGQNRDPESQMNMGESMAARETYVSDHEGMSFMLSHVATVESISPSASGLLGGDRITIKGTGFPQDTLDANVSIAGVPCQVLKTADKEIVCVLEPYNASAHPPAGEDQPGDRGINVSIWFDAENAQQLDWSNSTHRNALRTDPLFFPTAPNVKTLYQDLFEAPSDILGANGDSNGPMGTLKGFFRAPVTSNFTFILASDDSSQLWVGQNESTATQAIQFDTWCGHRDYSLNWEWRPYDYTPLSGIQKHSKRVSAPVELSDGQFLYLSAFYYSGAGGDHFSLAVKQHAASVNRKDSPFAVDEKQSIFVSRPPPSDEQHLIALVPTSVGGELSGTFTLSAAGSTTRPISVNATAQQVAAALREMLGSCSGAVGEENDSAGNTYDCVYGKGINYRGKANTYNGGQRCKMWRDAPDWNPRLALTAGLESNYCRNPDATRSSSVRNLWCYDDNDNRVRCEGAYNQCGLTEEDRKIAPYVATFEDESVNDDAPQTAGFTMKEGVIPRISRDSAFCGQQSLYIPNGYTRLRRYSSGDREVSEKLNGGAPTELAKFPYMCMAYKIPSTTYVAMRVEFRSCTSWSNANGACGSWGGFWRTIDMTNPPGTYDEPTNHWRSIGSWGIIADGEWHYKCINVLEMLNTNDQQTMQYSAHQVREVDFYPYGQPKAGHGTNEFWIDEFSQSATPRAVNRKADGSPAGLAGRVTRVSHVERAEVPGGGVTYKVNITYDDCSATKALDLSVNSSGISGPLSPETHLVSVPPPAPLSATVSVSHGGKVAEWSALAPASEVRDKLAPLIGNAKVSSFGTCADRGWEIHFLDLPGDRPLLAVSGAGNANVFAETVEDGGLVMGPIPVDYMHRVVDMPQAQVLVHKASTRCVGGACDFAFDDALTPTVESSVGGASEIPTSGNAFGASLVISGTKLDSTVTGAQPTVQVGSMPCAVSPSSSSASSISCAVSGCLPRASYDVSVMVPGRGRASGTLSVEIPTVISSVTPSSIDPALPTEVRVAGGGFSEDPSSNNITIGGLKCDVVSATCQEVVCMYPGTGGGSRRADGNLTVTIDVGGTPATSTSSIGGSGPGTAAPVISSITPTRGSGGGGDLLTVEGTDLNGGSVTVGGSPCITVNNTLAAQLTCTLGPGSPGNATVSVTTPAGSANGPVFEYVLSVSAVTSQSSMGLGGGVDITLDGEGMVSGGGVEAKMHVEVYGREVYVLSHYTPPLILEVQDVSLIGTTTSEVQTISIRNWANSSYEGDFAASWFGATTAPMKRGVNEYLLQRALSALLPSGSDAILSVSSSSSQQEGWETWSVTVSGSMGDLPSVNLSCTSCDMAGLQMAEETAGDVTSGAFSLSASNETNATSTLVPANATASDLESLLSSELGIDAQVSTISPSVAGAIRTWRVTFRDYAGVRPLLSAAPPAPETNQTLSAGGDLAVERITPGTGKPEGYWNIHLEGSSSSNLALNATEDDVKSAIQASFPQLKAVKVVSIDDAPGPLSDRFYPRQWIVTFSRTGVAGLGIQRCTHPQYVDWDPSACPSVAGDLFLSFHDYYWPSGLAQPSDLGTESSQERFLRACAEEARTLNYVPLSAAECHARVPSETLAVCGVGSGTSPPCWTERFTTASVRHKDGKTVTYMRDDSETPTDLKKGYRFWRQVGLQEAMQAQQMSANATVTISGINEAEIQAVTGISSRRESSKAAEIISYNASTVTNAQLVAPSPRVTRHARTLTQIISDDVLYVPISTWRLGSMQGTGVSAVPGALPQDVDGAAGMSNASLLTVPYSVTSNPPAGGSGGTIEIWARPVGSISSEVMSPLMWSVGTDSASGYALGIDTDGNFTFLLGNGNTSGVPAPESRRGMLVFASGAWMACKASSVAPLSAWSHVAGVWGGGKQRLYVNGQLACEQALDSAPATNLDGPVVFGGGCQGASAAQCADSSHHCSSRPECGQRCATGCATWADGTIIGGDFVGDLDEAFVYERALSPASIAGHAGAISEEIIANVGFVLNGVVSRCDEASSSCAVSFSASATPSLSSVSPDRGQEGSNITVSGRGFGVGMTITVGGLDCVVQGDPTGSEATCTVGAVGLGSNKVSVSVPDKGASANTLTFTAVAEVSSITPSQGSSLGGATLTITGYGLAQATAVVAVGQHGCTVLAASQTTITCLLPRFSSPHPDGTLLPISVKVGGYEAQGPARTFAPGAGTAFALASISPATVSDGTQVTLTGTDLPTDVPEVIVGGASCNVTGTPTPTEVLCTVGSDGVGGSRLPVSVRYSAGFADHTPSGGITVQHSVTLTSVIDQVNSSSLYGGRTITLSGASFSPASPGQNIVRIGGRACEVVSATSTEIVAVTPAEAKAPSGGAESAVARGSGSAFASCVANLTGNGTDLGIVDTATVAAIPPGKNAAWRLTDGDPNTVWKPEPFPSGDQVLVVDLGSDVTVHAVSLHYEFAPTGTSADPMFKSIGISSACDQASTAVNITSSSSTGVASLDTPQAARYLVLALALPLPQSGGIRGVAVSTMALQGAPQPITVDVRGAHGASCDGCSITYTDDAPSITSVSPASVSVGDAINISASNLASCANLSVTVGGAPCPVSGCVEGGSVSCTVPAVRGGMHKVVLSVGGLGRAGESSDMSIDVQASICEVQPSVIGPGGGREVTILGGGLAPGSTAVEVCGAECSVSSSNETHIVCQQAAYGDRSVTAERNSINVAVATGGDDAMEWVTSGAVDAGSKALGYDMVNADALAMQRVYMRFPVDIPNGATVTDARLHLTAEGESCDKGSVLNIRFEESDDAPAIEPWIRSGLSGRAKGETLEWTTSRKWMWPEEDQESADISTILQAVVDRPGWRAGSHVLVEIEQETFRNSNNGWIHARSPCRILAKESGFPASLRATFTAPATPPASPSGTCNITVAGGKGICSTGLMRAKASASSSVVSLSNDHKESYPKEDAKSGGGYNWWQGRDLCAKHSARICVKDDIWDSDASSPMAWVGADPSNTNIYTPYYHYWGYVGDAADRESWLNLETGDLHMTWAITGRVAVDLTMVHNVACCMGVGHPASMAADGDDVTFWRSGAGQAGQDGATLTLELEAGKEMVESIQIVWGRKHAVAFSLEASEDRGASWETVASEIDGEGGSTSYAVWPSPRAYTHVRVVSTEFADGMNSVEISEVKVTGCVRGPAPGIAQSSTTCSASTALATADQAASPSVSSVTPARGTTAGGSDVTIVGRFFEASMSDISVSIGGFPCAVESVQHNSSDVGNIMCKTTASGPSHGGKKYVVVSIAGQGSNRPGLGNDTFWYIDTWSARTTWGGQEPPTGCGEYSADRLCTETIVIPEGQTVLLDVSPPRFYLILVEGTLMFDRKDLHLQAHYILLRGGTLQIGTEDDPFMHQAQITMFGHPKSIELPTFGSKVIACYRCTLDMHGAPQKSWTKLASTAQVGDDSITLVDPVTWPLGSRIVIATTDFESPKSSHSEVASIASVSNDGLTLTLSNFSVCSTYDHAGIPSDCVSGGSGFVFPHLGESRTFDGRVVYFRAEVGLLNRNVKVIGDHDSVLCPNPDIADDGQTKLSCNQFGAQLFFHTPGHESLTVRLSNIELANGGQAFRLGRYAIHWHMIGNVRNSFQRDVVVHNSWNRGVAIHGTNHLRLQSNFIYTINGHSFFIEDGTEEFNRVEDNLGIKTIPSMNLLNTDQTPAVFWIVTMSNYVLRNHAVASRKYGIWMRPEISVTGTSVNTPMEVHPINIPILQIEGNEVHSNGKYGLRVFDIYKPNAPSVVKDLFTWRNGRAGWTATVIGQIGFDGVVSVQQGGVTFESRSTDVPNWDVAYVRNALIVDDPGSPPLPLAESYAMVSDDHDVFTVMGGPQEAGMLFPWNEQAGGGFSVANVTFVNFANACLRGCAHCGRGGSPVLGDGAFETRFSGMKFVNSPERALFRHPNEAFFYDLDGTLTDSGVKEDYTQGGSIKGSSMVGRSVLIPPERCQDSSMSTQGTGGAVCDGLIFRRSWYHPRNPSTWVGKALCVRSPWTSNSSMNHCQNLQPDCNCFPYLKKKWKGHVWLAADGYRYNMQVDLLPHEMADPVMWEHKVWDTRENERFQFTQRFLQFRAADSYGRNLMWTRLGSTQDWGLNWKYNASYCTEGIGCGRIDQDANYGTLVDDQMGVYVQGIGGQGNLAVPNMSSDAGRAWTFHQDADGNGGQHTHQINGNDNHQGYTVTVEQCPRAGCWPPPPPPPPPPLETNLAAWSEPQTWLNLTDSVLNPHNTIRFQKKLDGKVDATVTKATQWAGDIPGENEDVWIPSWKRVIVDVAKTPVLGHVIVEGVLVINSTESVELTATYLEIRGGSVIIAEIDINATAIGDFMGNCTIKLVGTNPKLKAIHGGPRETPNIKRGKQGVVQAAGMLGVFGTLVARGKRVSHAWTLLSSTAAKGSTEMTVDGTVDWVVGSEVLVSPSRYNMHESETRTVTAVAYESGTGRTRLSLDRALDFDHYADSAEMAYGTKTLRMQSEVALLTRNIVITGDGEGEKGVGGITYEYDSWNSQRPIAGGNKASCGNSVCERSEDSEKCPEDCKGPAHEYGATLHVLGYTEDYTACDPSGSCQSGYRRSFKGTAEISDVEFRYFGQNDLRAGFSQSELAGNVTMERVSFNRGYYYAIELLASDGASIKENVMYRAMLPVVRVGPKATGARVEGNLAVVGIWWNTHRGSEQGKGLNDKKRDAMIGMYLDQSPSTVMIGNRAVGSERAGFMGHGKPCGVSGEFYGNEVHSSLSGFWWDPSSKVTGCREISGITAWRIYLYGFYTETQKVGEVRLTGFKAADVRGAAIESLMAGGSSLGHELVDVRVNVSDALLVGQSDNAGSCSDAEDKPGLHTCKHFMAWCTHLDNMPYAGIVISNFMSGGNMAPLIKPWNDAGSYPNILGRTDIDRVTFVNYGNRCGKTMRAIRANYAAPDANHPLYSTNAEVVNVTKGESNVGFFKSNPKWISQDDCIDMDCDANRNSLVRDEDGTLFADGVDGQMGAAVARADFFNDKNFFGKPYNHPMNVPSQDWWYPNVPPVMRTTKSGGIVNVTQRWLSNGYGIPRQGCTLYGDTWQCPTTQTSYRMLVLENMDADHEIRRISPVAFSSDDGYTHLANGAQDHGWCFSYTCLKRLMTFWTTVAVNQPYTVHFASTEPQHIRMSLLDATPEEAMILRIYYTSALRLQVFVGGVFKEDVNMKGGKFKAQLFKNGKVAANDGNGGWAPQKLALDCACKVGDTCHAAEGASTKCDTDASNAHGVSTFVKSTGMLEVVVRGHAVDQFVEIIGMPVVQVSMGVSVSVDKFYEVKDTFISNLASVLGISPGKITIVDVVAGNARRSYLDDDEDLDESGGVRRSGDTAEVTFEVEPDAEIEVEAASVLVSETAGSVTLKVIRKTNVMGNCTVDYSVSNVSGTTAVPGTDFAASSGTLSFDSTVTEQTITVDITDDTDYSADKTFALVLSSPVGASLKTAASIVTIQNVNPPTPEAPTVVSAEATTRSVTFSWSGTAWPSAPSGDDGSIASYDLQCKIGDGNWSDAVRYDAAPVTNASTSDLGTSATITDLETYALVVCRLRAVTASGSLGAYSSDSAEARSLPVCSDGSRAEGAEGCDDGNLDAGDGCSASCTVEPGFSCSNPGGADTCSGGCGNGTRESEEQCDDGDTDSEDGCSSACSVEDGWICTDASPSVCSTTCGDGTKAGAEACDDGNTGDGDGCSATCTVESGGWTCSEPEGGGASTCKNCGNDLIEAGEVCDDSNNADGCVSCTQVTTGWMCTGAGADSCVAGPAVPSVPTGTGGQMKVTWSWIAPDGRGLAITGYTVETRNSTEGSPVNSTEATSATVIWTGLASGTSYVARVKACTSAGCSAFSAWSFTASTNQAPVAVNADDVSSATEATSQAEGISFSATNLTVVNPPPPAEEPVETGPVVYTIGFASSTYTVSVPADGLLTVTVSTLDASGSVATIPGELTSTVNWEIVPGTAEIGVDFTSDLTGTLTIDAGSNTTTLDIPIVSDANYSASSRTFTVTLSTPDIGEIDGVSLSLDSSFTSTAVSIEHVAPVPVTIGFAKNAYDASVPSASSVIVTVSILDSLGAQPVSIQGEKSVVWTIDPGTAASGVDFTGSLTGTLVIPSGSSTADLSIPLVTSASFSSKPRTLDVMLSSPSGFGDGYDVSLHTTLKQTTVSIASDTDGATSVSFEAATTAVMVSNGSLYLKLNVDTTAQLQPQEALLSASITLADGTAQNLTHYVAISPLSVTVPYSSGVHAVDVPILLLAGGGTTTFTATLDSVTSVYPAATLGKGSTLTSTTVSVKDDSAAPESATDLTVAEFTSTVSGVTRSEFLMTMATSYREGVANVSNVSVDSVAIISVTSTRRSGTLAVSTAVSVPTSGGDALRTNLQAAQQSGSLVTAIISAIQQGTGASVTLTTTEIVARTIAATTSTTTSTSTPAPTPAPAATTGGSSSGGGSSSTKIKYDSHYTVAGQAWEIKVSGLTGAKVDFPADSLPANVLVRARTVVVPAGAALPFGSALMSKVLSLDIPATATVSKSLSLVLPRSSPATRRQLSAGVEAKMHWLDKLGNKWTEVCGEHTVSSTGTSVLAVVEPAVLNDVGFNPASGCTLCDGEGGFFAIFDIERSRSTCNVATTTTPAPSWNSAAVIGGAVGGTLGGLLIVALCLGCYLRYGKNQESGNKGKQESLLRGAPPSKQELAESGGAGGVHDEEVGIGATLRPTLYAMEEPVTKSDHGGGTTAESRPGSNSPITPQFDSNLTHVEMSKDTMRNMEKAQSDGSLGKKLVSSPDGQEMYQVIGDVLVVSQNTPRAPDFPAFSAIPRTTPMATMPMYTTPMATMPMPNGGPPLLRPFDIDVKSPASLPQEAGHEGGRGEEPKEPIAYSILHLAHVVDNTPEKVGSHTKEVVEYVSSALPPGVVAAQAEHARERAKRKEKREAEKRSGKYQPRKVKREDSESQTQADAAGPSMV